MPLTTILAYRESDTLVDFNLFSSKLNIYKLKPTFHSHDAIDNNPRSGSEKLN
jgi:hypothetical protein